MDGKAIVSVKSCSVAAQTHRPASPKWLPGQLMNGRRDVVAGLNNPIDAFATLSRDHRWEVMSAAMARPVALDYSASDWLK